MSHRVLRGALACVILLAMSGALAARASADARIDLVPERAAPWRAERLIAPFRAATRGPRELRVITEPPGARLALAYARGGIEQRSASGIAPLELRLPSLANTAPGDSLTIRAEQDGFAPRELVLGASVVGPELRIVLARLPNRVLAVSLLELGDRARLTLVSEQPLDARLANSEQGWRLVLPEVALDARFETALAAIHGATVASATASLLARDVRVELTRGGADAGRELRMTTGVEPVRALHRFTLEWVPADGGAASLAAARKAVAGHAIGDRRGCGAEFDRALRAALEPAELSRALAPCGAFTDAFLSIALERLAESSANGEVTLRDGSRVTLARPLERERILAQPADVLGMLDVLRSLAASLAQGGALQPALHAWLAPELSAAEFAAAFERAASAEARCGAQP